MHSGSQKGWIVLPTPLFPECPLTSLSPECPLTALSPPSVLSLPFPSKCPLTPLSPECPVTGWSKMILKVRGGDEGKSKLSFEGNWGGGGPPAQATGLKSTKAPRKKQMTQERK